MTKSMVILILFYGIETVLEYAENLPIIDTGEILNKEKFIMENNI